MNYINLIPLPARTVIRDLFGLRLKKHSLFVEQVRDKSGLEIGGPSGTFLDSGVLPLYRYVKSLDNCVFSNNTLWEGKREDHGPFVFHDCNPAGCNYILDATNLDGIASDCYDFILSSHSLEHLANPAKALREWMRVVRSGGILILILPDYRKTFDCRRTPTSLRHMLEDFERDTAEDDTTHIDEVLALHEWSRDPIGGDYQDFRRRVLNNSQYRYVHHHVFDENNSRELLEAVGMNVLHVEMAAPWHIVFLASMPSRS